MTDPKYRHHKHPDHLYTIIGTGIISVLATSPIGDMEPVTIFTCYGDGLKNLWVCRPREFMSHHHHHSRIVMDGLMQARNPVRVGDPVTVYQSDDTMSTWVRHTSEFNDGRFLPVEEQKETAEMIEAGVNALVAWEDSSDPDPRTAVIAIYRSMKSLDRHNGH